MKSRVQIWETKLDLEPGPARFPGNELSVCFPVLTIQQLELNPIHPLKETLRVH